MVFAVSKAGIIVVLMGNRTLVYRLITSVAHIRRLIKSGTAFLYEILTGLVAGRAGSTFNSADDDLVAGICLAAVIAFCTEVFSIQEHSLVIPVRVSMSLNLLGDSGRILAEESGDILERGSIVQGSLNIQTILKGEMFLVAWNIFTHSVAPSIAVRRNQ